MKDAILTSSVIKYTDLQDDAQSIGDAEDTNNVVTGPSDEPSNKESEEDNQEHGVEAGSEENDSQNPINALPRSAEGNRKTHSMATSLDGTRLKCTRHGCNEEQEVISTSDVISHLRCTSNQATLLFRPAFTFLSIGM